MKHQFKKPCSRDTTTQCESLNPFKTLLTQKNIKATTRINKPGAYFKL